LKVSANVKIAMQCFAIFLGGANAPNSSLVARLDQCIKLWSEIRKSTVNNIPRLALNRTRFVLSYSFTVRLLTWQLQVFLWMCRF